MLLRYAVNQAEAFRCGVDCPQSIQTIKINPADLTQEQRDMIADRMEGIDVCELDESGKKQRDYVDAKLKLLQAKLPTLEAFLEAVLENDAQVVKED